MWSGVADITYTRYCYFSQYSNKKGTALTCAKHMLIISLSNVYWYVYIYVCMCVRVCIQLYLLHYRSALSQ